MREILFRGKRIDNGRWEEGYFLKYALIYEEQTHILPLGSVCDSGIEIDSKTVCQYTGLKDRNGRKIFEGDIVLSTHDLTQRSTSIFHIFYAKFRSYFLYFSQKPL